jgi:hypothetical protein
MTENPPPSPPLIPDDDLEVTPEAYTEGFGEEIQRTLDVDTWQTGEDLATIYERIETEVREAVRLEESHRRLIREKVFPRFAEQHGGPENAGVFQADDAWLKRIHRGLLFNGSVEACDGTLLSHDSLPVTIFQIGVSLVSYQGHQGTWSHRLFRRDLRVSGGDPTEEMIDLLKRREERSGLNHASRRDALSTLARRGIMAYAERAILLKRSTAVWRMGHGSPAPLEVMPGGNLDLMIEATRAIRELIEGHQKFIYVSSEPRDRLLLTIGEALRPSEYAIVRSLRDSIYRTVEHGHYGGRHTSETTWDGQILSPQDWVLRFRDEVASQVIVGVYRATRLAPPQIFYAHTDHAHAAAHIALADSVLQEHRGFPLLIDLADAVCRGVFGRESIEGPVATAYAEAGAPWRYLSERETRYRG